MKKKILCAVLAAAFTVSAIAGCSADSGDMSGISKLTKKLFGGKDNKEETKDKFGFYYDCYDKLSSDKNLVFSPYSLYSALSLAVNGMDEGSDPYAQTSKVMGIKGNIKDLDTKGKEYRDKLFEDEGFKHSDSAWMGNKLTVSDSGYKKDLKDYFDADFFNVKLTSYDFVKKANGYVSDKTNGMIKNLISEPASSENGMCLIDTLYMNKTWNSPYQFADNLIGKEFNGKPCDMMTTGYDKDIGYKKAGGLELAYIDYKYGNQQLVLIKSADKWTSTKDAIKKLGKNKFIKLVNSDDNFEDYVKVNVTMPEFTHETKKDYTKTLKDIGLTDLFNKNLNNFPRIAGTSSEKQSYISHILQKAKIKCNRKGTEAAAATETEMAIAGSLIEKRKEPKKIDFTCDKPFVYIILSNGVDSISYRYVGNMPLITIDDASENNVSASGNAEEDRKLETVDGTKEKNNEKEWLFMGNIDSVKADKK